MSRTRWLAIITLVLLLSPVATVRAEGAVVQGQVINRTAGATAALGGLTVRLYIYSDGTLKDTRQATTDEQGAFRFESVSAGAGWLAVAAVEYEGVEYDSQQLDLSQGTDYNSDISVYETTADDSALTLERSHLIIEMGSGQLEVTELAILTNTGDRSYLGASEVIPDRRATAQIPLPAGATDVSFADPEVAQAMVRTGQGYVDTRPIIPGQQEYVLSYALPCDGPTYNLLKPVVYPTAAIDVLIAAPGAEVDAPALENLGTREASGATYLHLGGQSLAEGTDIMIRFSGLGQAAPVRAAGSPGAEAPVGAAREPWWPLPVALGTLAPLLGALVAYLRREGPHVWPQGASPTPSAIDAECSRLAAAMADLDDRYEAAELDEGSYRRQREELRSQLLSLLPNVQGEESDSKHARGGPARSRAARSRPRKEVRPRARPAQRKPQSR